MPVIKVEQQNIFSAFVTYIGCGSGQEVSKYSAECKSGAVSHHCQKFRRRAKQIILS